MSIDISEYKVLYIKTARTLLETMEASLEKLKLDFCDDAAITEFHRAAHSFKSQSLVMGYTKTGMAGRVLEQLFLGVKDKKECIDAHKVPVISALVSKMRASLDAIERQEGEVDLSADIGILTKLTSLPLM